MNVRRSKNETEETQEMPASMLAELKKLSSIPPPERQSATSDNREPLPEPPEAA